MSKTLHRNLQAKMGGLQGPEWDSSDEEEAEQQVVKSKTTKVSKKTSTKDGAKQSKKAGKKNDKEANKEDETEKDATVLYIGHLPIEFEERDLKIFLQQFGKVVNLRISRSVSTGNSRGYAFVRWEDAETARIVADTLQGYFVGQRRLICHLVPNPPKGMFFHTDKVIDRRKIRNKAAEKQRSRELANVGKLKEITARLVQRERKKRGKFAALGIDYDFPGYEASQMNVDENEDSNVATKGENDDKDATPKSSDKKVKRRKDSVDSIGSASSESRKRKDSVGSEGSASKKSKRKDSVGSEASAPDSSSKKEKKERKDSIGSEGSASKKSKRKDSVGSEASAPHSSSKKEKKERKESVGTEASPAVKGKTRTAEVESTPTKKKPVEEKVVQSEKKSKKEKKNKKRRQSAP